MSEKNNILLKATKHEDLINPIKDFVDLFTFVNITFIRRLKKECNSFATLQHAMAKRVVDFTKYLFSRYKKKERAITIHNTELLTELNKDKEEKNISLMLKSNVDKLKKTHESEVEKHETEFQKLAEKVRFLKKRNKELIETEGKYLTKLNTQAFKLSKLSNMYKQAQDGYENMKIIACNCIEKALNKSVKKNDRPRVQELAKVLLKEKMDDVLNLDQISTWLERDTEKVAKYDFWDIEKVIGSDESHETLTDDEHRAAHGGRGHLNFFVAEEGKREDDQQTSKKPLRMWKSPSFTLDAKNKTPLNPD
jgi:hypothetical protein